MLEQCAAEAGLEPNAVKMVQKDPKTIGQYEEEVKESIQKGTTRKCNSLVYTLVFINVIDHHCLWTMDTCNVYV